MGLAARGATADRGRTQGGGMGLACIARIRIQYKACNVAGAANHGVERPTGKGNAARTVPFCCFRCLRQAKELCFDRLCHGRRLQLNELGSGQIWKFRFKAMAGDCEPLPVLPSKGKSSLFGPQPAKWPARTGLLPSCAFLPVGI